MGFWSTLGKVGMAAAPIVAAPFTGGASLALTGLSTGAKIAKIASNVAPILSSMAGGRAEGRQEDIRNAYVRDELALRRAGMEQDAQQMGFNNEMKLNNLARRDAVYANRPMPRGGIPGFMGGGAPASAMPTAPKAPVFGALPQATPEPKSGILDKILSIAGPATSLMGAFNDPYKNTSKTPLPGGKILMPTSNKNLKVPPLMY